MSSHQSAAMLKDEWLTPRDLLKPLGKFDLDPCAPIVRPWPTAERHFTIEDDGLSQQWSGRIWLNPPYGQNTGVWFEKFRRDKCYGTALIFARTETELWFRHVWGVAHRVLFLQGRLYFHHVSGQRAKANAGAPNALIAYGEFDAAILDASGIPGRLITP